MFWPVIVTKYTQISCFLKKKNPEYWKSPFIVLLNIDFIINKKQNLRFTNMS